jgi:hypothetical protein
MFISIGALVPLQRLKCWGFEKFYVVIVYRLENLTRHGYVDTVQMEMDVACCKHGYVHHAIVEGHFAAAIPYYSCYCSWHL